MRDSHELKVLLVAEGCVEIWASMLQGPCCIPYTSGGETVVRN